MSQGAPETGDVDENNMAINLTSIEQKPTQHGIGLRDWTLSITVFASITYCVWLTMDVDEIPSCTHGFSVNIPSRVS